MKNLFSEFDELALELLSEDGVLTTVTHESEGEYVNGEAPVIFTEYSCLSLVFTVPTEYVNGTSILDNDSQAYCKFLDPQFSPTVGDKFNWLDKQLEICSVRETAPSGLKLYHVLQVRNV